jgi:hypothetical protein
VLFIPRMLLGSCRSAESGQMAVNHTSETLPGPSVNRAVVAKNAPVSRLNYGVVILIPLALNERRMSGHADERDFLNDVCGRVQITLARRRHLWCHASAPRRRCSFA